MAFLDWLGAHSDALQALTSLLGVAGGLGAAFWALLQFNDARTWKKSELAQKIIGEIFADAQCLAAMRMADWERGFLIEEGQPKIRINRGEVVAALRVANTVFDAKEIFIRDCFDQLLDAFQRLEHYLATKLLDFKDVQYPLRYTVEELSAGEIRVALDAYMQTYKFDYARDFLDRYEFWIRGEDASRPFCVANAAAQDTRAP